MSAARDDAASSAGAGLLLQEAVSSGGLDSVSDAPAKTPKKITQRKLGAGFSEIHVFKPDRVTKFHALLNSAFPLADPSDGSRENALKAVAKKRFKQTVANEVQERFENPKFSYLSTWERLHARLQTLEGDQPMSFTINQLYYNILFVKSAVLCDDAAFCNYWLTNVALTFSELSDLLRVDAIDRTADQPSLVLYRQRLAQVFPADKDRNDAKSQPSPAIDLRASVDAFVDTAAEYIQWVAEWQAGESNDFVLLADFLINCASKGIQRSELLETDNIISRASFYAVCCLLVCRSPVEWEQLFSKHLPLLLNFFKVPLLRVAGINLDYKYSPVQEWLWSMLLKLFDVVRYGLAPTNKCLLVLYFVAEKLCTPDRAVCRLCPLKPQCFAYQMGEQEGRFGFFRFWVRTVQENLSQLNRVAFCRDQLLCNLCSCGAHQAFDMASGAKNWGSCIPVEQIAQRVVVMVFQYRPPRSTSPTSVEDLEMQEAQFLLWKEPHKGDDAASLYGFPRFRVHANTSAPQLESEFLRDVLATFRIFSPADFVAIKRDMCLEAEIQRQRYFQHEATKCSSIVDNQHIVVNDKEIVYVINVTKEQCACVQAAAMNEKSVAVWKRWAETRIEGADVPRSLYGDDYKPVAEEDASVEEKAPKKGRRRVFRPVQEYNYMDNVPVDSVDNIAMMSVNCILAFADTLVNKEVAGISDSRNLGKSIWPGVDSEFKRSEPDEKPSTRRVISAVEIDSIFDQARRKHIKRNMSQRSALRTFDTEW